jgi:hypothetical protein
VIYFTRAAVILALLLAPKTDLTIYLFAAAMGLLWLSTVPLTSGIVAQVFGVRYMATLFGLVFLSHRQLSRRLARRLILRPDRLVRRDLVGRRGAGAGCGAHPSADRRAPAAAPGAPPGVSGTGSVMRRSGVAAGAAACGARRGTGCRLGWPPRHRRLLRPPSQKCQVRMAYSRCRRLEPLVRQR